MIFLCGATLDWHVEQHTVRIFFCDGSLGAGAALAVVGMVPRLERRTVG